MIGAKAHHLLGGGRRTGQLDGMTAQHGADPGQQLTGVERLGQIVIGPHLQPDDAIHFVSLGGEHQHRDLVARLPQTAADGEPVLPRQHQIEHHQAEVLAGQQTIRLFPVGNASHHKSLFGEVTLQQGA
ncbi:hypothetical protein D3C84_1052150 [compost metagenome]